MFLRRTIFLLFNWILFFLAVYYVYIMYFIFLRANKLNLALISVKFAETLRELGVEAKAILYEGKTHTDVFLQVYH